MFKPRTQIKDMIRNVKGREKLETEGVYQLECGTCHQTYVGETGRTIRTRVKEHSAAIRLGHADKSAVAEHAAQGHTMDIGNPKILAREKHFKTRIFREALEIKKHKNNFNRDSGQRISDAWLPVISRKRDAQNILRQHPPPIN